MSAVDKMLHFLFLTGYFEQTRAILMLRCALSPEHVRPFTLKSVLERLGPRQHNMLFMESVVEALDLSHGHPEPAATMIYTELAIFLHEFLKGHECDVAEFWASLPHAPAPLSALTGRSRAGDGAR